MTRVEAYAGASYPERRTAVWRGDQRIAVGQVLRSWRTPDALHFLVELESGEQQELCYQFRAEVWDVRTFEEPS